MVTRRGHVVEALASSDPAAQQAQAETHALMQA